MHKQLMKLLGVIAAAVGFVGLATAPANADPFFMYYAGPNFNQFGGDGWHDTGSNYLRAIIELNTTPTIGGGQQNFSNDIVNFVISDGTSTISDYKNISIFDYATQADEEGFEVTECIVGFQCDTQQHFTTFRLLLQLPNLALDYNKFLFPGASWFFKICAPAMVCLSSDSGSGDEIFDAKTGGEDEYAGTANPNDPRTPPYAIGSLYSDCSAFAFPDQKPADTIWNCSVNRDAGVPGPVNLDDLVLGPTPPTITDPFGAPEPITLSIFGAGLAGAAAMRCHKAKGA